MAKGHTVYYSGNPIGSVATLAKILDVNEKRLLNISANTSDHYIEFSKQVKTKVRTLSEPKPDLKLIQKRINNRIFCHLKFPHYLHGGIKAANPRDFYSNAFAHKNAEVAIVADIKSFFPSVTMDVIRDSFSSKLFNFPKDVADILAKLTTLKGILPQGAPTSSYIANFIISQKEGPVVSGFEQRGLTYTRLIDDMTISAEAKLSEIEITKIIKTLSRMLSNYQLTLHPDKTQIFSKSNPQKLMKITGLWLNRGTPKIDVNKRKEISRKVIELKKLSNICECKTIDYHEKYNSVSGEVALLERIGHTRAKRLRIMLQNIIPTYDLSKIKKVEKIVNKFSNRIAKNKIGYIHDFYKFQHQVSIVKRTNPKLAKTLQNKLNKQRPNIKMRDLDE